VIHVPAPEKVASGGSYPICKELLEEVDVAKAAGGENEVRERDLNPVTVDIQLCTVHGRFITILSHNEKRGRGNSQHCYRTSLYVRARLLSPYGVSQTPI